MPMQSILYGVQGKEMIKDTKVEGVRQCHAGRTCKPRVKWNASYFRAWTSPGLQSMTTIDIVSTFPKPQR